MSHQIFKFSDQQEKRLPVNLLYASHSRYDKEWHSTLHNHQFTELFYILSGTGSFIFNQNTIEVKKNDFIVINPNIEHTEKSTKSGLLEYIALGFQGLSFSPLENTHLLSGILLRTENHKNLSNLLERILDEFKNQKENFELICQNLLEILILEILREGRYSLKHTEAKKINHNVFVAKRYIDQFYKTDISLTKLAEVSHMSKYYLAHSFKETIGLSPIEYLTQVRIGEAKILLESTNHSIAGISEIIGFSSQSYFSQCFKNSTQKTPSEYRKESFANI